MLARTLVAAAGGLAVSRTHAATDALAPFLRARLRPQIS